MAYGEPEEHTTNQEASEGILAAPNCIELPSAPQSQPLPSGQSDDGTHDSGCEERHDDFEEDENQWKSGNGTQDDGVEEENQEEGNGAEDADQEGNDEVQEENQADDNEPENGNQGEDNEAEQRNQAIRNDAEAVNQQDGRAAGYDFANIPEFNEVIGFGERIPFNPSFPLQFSQTFLDWLEPHEVKFKIDAISSYSKAVSRLEGLVRFSIIDVPVLKDAVYLRKYPTIPSFQYEGRRCHVEYYKYHFAPHQGDIPTQQNISTQHGRIFIFQGSSQMAKEINSTLAHKICPLIFPGQGGLPDYFNNGFLSRCVDLHIPCEERPRSVKRGFNGGDYTFHTTFFELQQSLSTKPDCWDSGRLYSLNNTGGESFRKACITIGSMSTADLPNEWNIAILTPSNFFGTFAFESDKMHYLRLRFSAMNSTSCQDTMLQVITKSVEVIVDRWQELYDEVRKECDGENVSFMDGEQYVHLLYDDGNFRRSRFYFWAIGCLSSFEQSVAETLWELSTFRKEVDHDSPFYRGVVVGRFKIERIYNQEMDFFDQACRNLGGILDQLVKKRDEMKVLRDGLFSASSVMESKQSRILGENVQLLAFVTIFFLPLAFSASLWSIPGVNDKYPGVMIPGAFAAVIGFITYFIVFNLNLLISGLRRLLAVPRNFLLKNMAKENNPKGADRSNTTEENNNQKPSTNWPKRAKAFEVFPRQDEGLRPSNWLLLFYAIRLLVINVFDLVIGLLTWLRKIIASNPSTQNPDTEMAEYRPSNLKSTTLTNGFTSNPLKRHHATP